MGKTTAQVLIEEGEKRGEERGMIRAKQEDLLELMQTKLSSVPPDVTGKIESIQDIERLSALFRKGLTASSIDEMRIE